MNFNKFGGKILLGLVTLVAVLSCVNPKVIAEGETGIKYLKDDPIANYRKDGNYTYPTKTDYVFAGWYNDAEGKDPMTEEEANEAAKANETPYAKWVPDYVLSVQAQVNKTALDDNINNTNKAAIRLLTSVDSLNYASVGFDVVRGDYPDYTYHLNSKHVFSKVRIVGETEGEYTEHTPEEVFGSASHFFETVTFKNMPKTAVNTELTAIPYWVTLDGTTVKGTKSIKTVNLGRSWVYVATSKEVNPDGIKLGTYDHPFADFADGLDKIQLENKGRVIAKGNSPIPVSSEFAWNKHTVKVDNVEKACTITITGENSSAGFDFSAFSPLYINDNVVFDNMTLKFDNGENLTNVYANGNRFVIGSSVISDNAVTTIFGGGNNATLTSGTNVEIHAGNYKEIWGGNKDGGSINGDIHVTVTNANVFNTEKTDNRRVFGGGWGKSTVNGDIYVTVGQGFNKDYSQPTNNYNIPGGSHSRSSAVYGAGAGGEIVNGSTYVTIADNAKVDYVYGGGSASSGIVNGTCHVTLNGGTVFSIYGGAQGDTAVTEEAKYRNKDTSVVIASGEVWQIMGGNGSGMTGNTYVEISGGKVHRRIYGGCYSDTVCVDGRTTVVINKSDSLVFDTLLAEKLYAGSGNTGNANEIKTIVFNDVYSANKLNSSKDYNYLVTKQGNGSVAVDKTILQLTPISNDVVGSITSGDTASYFRGISKYILAGATENGKKEVSVDFSPNGTLDLTSCEALNEGIYYSKLEDAVVAAKEISLLDKACTVTLLKDATIEESIVVDKSAKFVLQSDGEKKITFASTEDSLIQVKDTAQLTLDSVTLYGGNIGLEGLSGKINTNNVMIDNATYGVVVRSTGNVNLDNVTIGTTGAHAIQSAGKLNITTQNTKDVVKKNGVTINSAGNYGINIMGGTVVANAVTVHESKSHALYVTETDDVTFTGLTVNKAGGNALYITKAGTKANISDFAIGTTTSAAVRLYDGVNLSLTDGTIQTSAYGIYMEGSAVADATNVKITRTASNANTLIVVKGTSHLTMSNNSNGESCVDGNKSAGYTGRGVEVQGTFILNGGNIINNQITADTEGAVITANKSDGAAVYVVAGGTFTMNGGALQSNQAKNAGAAVAVNGTGANFTLTEGTISGNKGTYGAVMARNGAFNMNGGTIANNTATSDGGGVIVSAGTFNMSGGKISGNTSTSTGGGVYMNGAGTIQLVENGTGMITGNTSGSAGGGVHISKGTFIISSGEISGNTAKTHGGGVAVTGSGVFNMNSGEISGNTATTYGGGLSLNSTGAISLSGTGLIDSNTANNNASGDNNAGGGVYLVKGTFNMTGGTVSSNKATNKDGGGVCVAGGTLNVQGGTITKNTAKAAGGGISVNGSSAILAINGGTINGNSAANGGAIIIRACKNDSTGFIMSAGALTGNTASANGGAIYLKQGFTFTMNGGEIKTNKAVLGGAIYVEKGSSSADASSIVYGGEAISGNISTSSTISATAKGIYCNGTVDPTTTAATSNTMGVISYTNGKTESDIADGVVGMVASTNN